MNGFDILILFVYAIVLWYVYQSIVDEIDKLTEVRLNKDFLSAQLTKFGLDEKLSFSFDFGRSPLTDTLNSFSISLENKTFEQYFEIHWNRSSLMDFDGKSQRIIRLPPALNIDLFQAQASSIISPREILNDKLTIESSLTLKDEDKLIYDITQPIFSSDLLKTARDEDLDFEVTLMIRCSEYGSDKFYPVLYPIICNFEVIKKPWQKALYWRPKTNQKQSDQNKKDKIKKTRKARKKAKDDYRTQQHQPPKN
ncbi:hypothetical protein Lepto7376_3259 [[Leptolyngbya] sp. PCC 7376]|uniref:hypothetical protein n=1 Tax=[Leptolyngbya] sp. PCC 7376 TaxID=111781 RepID=UPI00029F1F4A|nr:hypothetical protein [[Leptolyngbya] sp. PCC 7376]AFY39487.1 hypothetical protein Lepto7376_3259 [[Leptolyngbya] sp. PCC 7376]